jgi:hypothetical protein
MKNKCPYFARIFAARRRLDAGDHIYAPGMQRGDGFGDILRIQAASGDEL